MRNIPISAYDIASRFIGIREVPGPVSNPAILAMLQLDSKWPEDDAVPWCGAFCETVAWLLRLPRSKSLRARAWLHVGEPIPLARAEVGFDVVILSRGGGDQPGPDVIDAPGHVGFYAGYEESRIITDENDITRTPEWVLVLGGNQNDTVSIARFPPERVLGVRRLLAQ